MSYAAVRPRPYVDGSVLEYALTCVHKDYRWRSTVRIVDPAGIVNCQRLVQHLVLEELFRLLPDAICRVRSEMELGDEFDSRYVDRGTRQAHSRARRDCFQNLISQDLGQDCGKTLQAFGAGQHTAATLPKGQSHFLSRSTWTSLNVFSDAVCGCEE